MFLTKAGKIAFALNVTMMIVAFYIAKFFATGVAQRRCISLECWFSKWNFSSFCWNYNYLVLI
jgi:BASS family bile acid:Na+ symporter